MFLLSVSIPNYNRIDNLKRLISEVSAQIMQNNLNHIVQICISDDCSPENPTEEVGILQRQFSGVNIKYSRKQVNQGMDHNFKDCVLMADGEYCWIVGNDDLPDTGALKTVVDLLAEKRNYLDFMISPFNVYTENGNLKETIYPFAAEGEQIFNTSDAGERERYFKTIIHNSGLFAFLSNVVFKRAYWVKYIDCFSDKMDTIFIQMYVNIRAILDGAMIYYTTETIIKNYADDDTDNSIERIGKIVFGFDGIVEYYFKGGIKAHFKKILTDAYISGILWELPNDNEYRQRLERIDSQKNRLYKKYFIPPDKRDELLSDKKVVIYGAGRYGEKTFDEVLKYGCKVLAVIDSDIKKRGNQFKDLIIGDLDDLKTVYNAAKPMILVANHFHLQDMIDYLLTHNMNNIGIIC